MNLLMKCEKIDIKYNFTLSTHHRVFVCIRKMQVITETNRPYFVLSITQMDSVVHSNNRNDFRAIQFSDFSSFFFQQNAHIHLKISSFRPVDLPAARLPGIRNG